MDYAFLGSGLAFSAAVQPGPLQAFLFARVAQTGWKRTLPACLSPLVSDGPIALIALLVLGHVPPLSLHLLQAAGGVLLLFFAWAALRGMRKPEEAPAEASAPRTLRDAVLVNLMNPNPYLGWTLVLGPPFLAAWNEERSGAILLLGSFYGTMIATLAGFVVLVGTTRFLNRRARRALQGVSAGVLAVMGMLILARAIARVLDPTA